VVASTIALMKFDCSVSERVCDALAPSDVATAWRLPVEPWVYTVDTNGVIIHSFEGVIGDAELDAAILEIDAD
jgi:hypothetical protein